MKQFILKHPRWSILILFGIILICFACFYFLQLDDYQNFESSLIYYIIALFISAVLILLGYVKAQEAIEQSRTNYLLRIDERWSSPEIIKAREVIHELYLDAKHLNPELKEDNEQIKPVIALEIMKIHDSKEMTEKFVSLLNFLDFLETIGYLHSKKAITTEEVSELLGNSIIYFYDIFSIYIAYRRKTKDPGFYTKFEKLYLEVRLYCAEIKDKSLSKKCTSKYR